jgi:multicomponent Na+:H+ antiporter subunit A
VETHGVTNGAMLLAITLALPLAMLATCLSRPLRNRMPMLLAFAPLPAIAAALQAPDRPTLVLPKALLGLTFALDPPGAMLLGVVALLWSAAGAYAYASLRDGEDGGRLAVWWLMTLSGSLGIFIAADMLSFYLFFTLVSLAAYGLVVFDNTQASKRAGALYVGLAVLGEAFLLMAFVLLAAGSPRGSLLIHDAVAALPTSPWRDYALAFLILGFGVKIGLVPLHVWMPLTYSAAPIPAAAVLSGGAVKAGVIGLIRFLPLDTALPGWGEALTAVGLFGALYGVVIGITQSNPKTVLAYSSVSQMGLLAAVLGMGLATGDATAPIASAFYAVRHVLVKGGLFLALGVAVSTRSYRVWLVLLPAALLALGLGGLPLTGGTLAKIAIKTPLGDGTAGTLAILSAVGSTVLMLHFLSRLNATAPETASAVEPMSLVVPWLVIAFASIFFPWVLYPHVSGVSVSEALSPKELWAALWPVLIGGLLAVPLLRWGDRLPRVPEGDVLAFGESTVPAVRKLGAAMEGIDARLRQWAVSGVMFVLLTLLLIKTLLGSW